MGAMFSIFYMLLLMFHGYERVFEDPFDNWDFCRWYVLFFMLMKFVITMYVMTRQHYLYDDDNPLDAGLVSMVGEKGLVQIMAYNRQKSIVKMT